MPLSPRRIPPPSRPWPALALVLAVVCSLVWWSDLRAFDHSASEPQTPFPGTIDRITDFGLHIHDVGSLLLSVSNLGIFGNRGQSGIPSAEWPAGSRCEYLFAASLWVGGLYDHCEPLANFPGLPRDGLTYCDGDSTSIVLTDTLVSTGPTGFLLFEYFPDLFDPVERIYEAFEGRPGGNRGEDDDGDGWVDEDPLNGKNDDPLNDARIDEDYAAVSQQMFSCVYRDTATFGNDRITIPSLRHRPIGLEVVQESYQYTAPTFDDFVGLEFRVRNAGFLERGARVYKSLRQVFVGFFVDSDVGCIGGNPDADRHLDDRAGFVRVDTVLTFPGAPSETLTVNVGFMSDDPGGTEEVADAPGWFGTMFLGHTIDSTGRTAPDRVQIHAYKSWTNGQEDPDSDAKDYNLLTGGDPSPFGQVIDVGSQRSDDWRQLLSAGPFAELRPESTLIFQAAFVIGEGRDGLIANALSAQRIFNRAVDSTVVGRLTGKKISAVAREQLNHWSGASAPPPPNQRLVPGDHRVTIEWDNFSERVRDVLTGRDDFAGYQVWKAVGWRREATTPRDEQWFVIADVSKDDLGKFDTGLEGIGKYRLVDTEVKNGFPYWYAVTGYDSGDPERGIAPIFGKFSQAAALVYPKWGPTSSLGDELVIPDEAAPGVVGSGGPFVTLDNVHVVPNPYKERAEWDLEGAAGDPTGRRIYFVNLPERATIRIFSLTGDLLQTIEHQWAPTNPDPANPDAGTFWNLVTRNNQEVVSGVYIYQIESEVGTKIGKFAIIR